MSESPRPPKPIATLVAPTLLDFPSAMVAVRDGKRVRREEWEYPDVHVALYGDTLCIHNHDTPVNEWHPLLVRDGDLFGTDWIIVD